MVTCSPHQMTINIYINKWPLVDMATCRQMLNECDSGRMSHSSFSSWERRAGGFILSLLPVKTDTSFTKCAWRRGDSQVPTGTREHELFFI